MPTTAQIAQVAKKKMLGLRKPDAVVDDGRDRAGHVPRADQRTDGQQDEDRPDRRRDAADCGVGDRRDRVAVLEGDQRCEGALRNSATCSGPSVAATPNSQIVIAIRTISTTTGRTASSRLGGLGVMSVYAPAAAASACPPAAAFSRRSSHSRRPSETGTIANPTQRQISHWCRLEVLRVQDPLEEAELGAEQDRRERARPCSRGTSCPRARRARRSSAARRASRTRRRRC